MIGRRFFHSKNERPNTVTTASDFKALANRIVGVIDLRSNECVHAIAGRRHDYRPVRFVDGDALALARYYWDFGVRNLYIADLDGIANRDLNTTTLARIQNAYPWSSVLLDCGWVFDQQASSQESFFRLLNSETTHWVIPTESRVQPNDLKLAYGRCPTERLVLSLDYRSGKFQSTVTNEADWIQALQNQPTLGLLTLDIGHVGTGNPETSIALARRLCDSIDIDTRNVYSGGGVRRASNVQKFISVGCDRVLVASALYRPDSQ